MKKFFVLMIVAVLGCGAAMAQKGQMAVGGKNRPAFHFQQGVIRQDGKLKHHLVHLGGT